MAIDRRARLRPKDGGKNYVYGDIGLLTVLEETDGLVWPYTPTINVANSIDYSTYDPVHSNQEFMTFSRARAQTLTVTGIFTAQNPSEAKYMLACLHFLRSVTKMDFGTRSSTSGTPPPILLFSAYGQFMFNDLPVVVTNFMSDFSQDQDYVKVPLTVREKTTLASAFGVAGINQGQTGLSALFGSPGPSYPVTGDKIAVSPTNSEEDTWVPAELMLSVSLTVQNSPRRLSQEFDLADFKSGKLLKKGGWL